MALTIAMVGPSHPFRGGIAHHTTLLYRHLAERHDVRFYTFTRQYPRWCFPGETDRDVSARPLRAPGVEPSLDSLNPATWLRTAARVARIRPQLVIMPWWSSYWTPQFVTISRLLRRLTDTRLLAICHNVVDHEQRRLSRTCARAVLGAMDHCLVHCRTDERRLRALLPHANVTRAFHPLYDFARPELMPKAAARARLGVPGDAILFFGFVRPYKGLAHLLSAMPRILERRSVTLLVVGEFWKGSREAFRRQVRDLRLDGAVRCVDRYVPNEEVGIYFSAADLIVLPYVAGTGSGVAQMAYGLDKPVVATRVGAMEEVIADGQTGYLVPPAEPAALAEAIVRFFEDGREQHFVENIRQHKQRFSWQRLVEIVERLAVDGRPADARLAAVSQAAHDGDDEPGGRR